MNNLLVLSKENSKTLKIAFTRRYTFWFQKKDFV